MWSFSGIYTGDAKAYIREKQKKEIKLWAIGLIIMSLIGSGMILAAFLKDNPTQAIAASIITFFFLLIICGLGLFLEYRKVPKCAIKIQNDGFEIYTSGKWCPLPFYKITEINEYDDFIAVEDISRFKIALQKNLLVEGDWEELKAFLKKVEESLETDEPMYQMEEPFTEYFESTVKSKRIYERFVNGVSWTTPVGRFQYFVTFLLENGEEREYEVEPDTYEKMEDGQTGLLVLVNGNFFAFGDGEEIEEE